MAKVTVYLKNAVIDEIKGLVEEQIQTAQLAAAEAAAHTRHEKTVLDITPENKSPL